MVAQSVAPRARSYYELDFDLIDRRLAELGIEPDGLAEYVGIDQSTVFRLRKRQTNPSLGTAMELSERLGVTVNLLVQKAA